MKRLFVLLLALSSAAAEQSSADLPGRLDDLIRREMAAKQLKAFSIALIDHDKIVYSKDYDTPANTIYRVGSVSKLFTDVAIMQLVEQGQLDLDAPVSRYIPEFHPKNSFELPITLRLLMSHRSGLVREPPIGNYFDTTGPTLEQTVMSLNDTEVVYPPGERTKYSNAGIAVAGYVLEKVQSRAFADSVSHSVIIPLGMKMSAFEPVKTPEPVKAWMWTLDGRTFEAPTFQLGMKPAGSMYSTTGDLASFLMALFAGGGSVLERATIEKMWTPQFDAPAQKTGYGLGFRIAELDGHRLVGHGGAIYGFATDLEALPDDQLGVIAITNKDGANPVVNLVAREALRWMLASNAGKPMEPVEELSQMPAKPTDLPSRRKPLNPPAAWQGLIGEYGWDFNTLYIHERGGKLAALIEWFHLSSLTPVSRNVFRMPDDSLYAGEKVLFVRDKTGRATAVRVGGVTFPRRPDPAAPGSTFRIKPVRPLPDLRSEAQAARPPAESGDFRAPELMELIHLDSSIRLDIRYASSNNFMSTPFYTQARAFLQRPAADALVRAHRKLKALGYGLLIHDAYRPWFVTKMFWDGTPPDKHDFVADPSKGSRHNRGCAVDLTLYDLATGRPIQMTGGYDEMSTRSYPDYPGGTWNQRWHRDLLRRSMEDEGFRVYDFEWWHFDFKDWDKYPILNKRFEAL